MKVGDTVKSNRDLLIILTKSTVKSFAVYLPPQSVSEVQRFIGGQFIWFSFNTPVGCGSAIFVLLRERRLAFVNVSSTWHRHFIDL